MKPIVAKFGGTSVATAERIGAVCKIVRDNPGIRAVVVSNAGKRHSNDVKLTDAAIALTDKHHTLRERYSVDDLQQMIVGRFIDIQDELGVHPISRETFARDIRPVDSACEAHYVISRGECYMAQILAEVLGFTYVDAKDLIMLNEDGSYNIERSRERARVLLGDTTRKYVVPGFYGSLPDGSVQTLSRGGSDVVGSWVAQLMGAVHYENWTDTSVRITDPRVVPGALHVPHLTYEEMRELSYMGSSIIHEDAMLPLVESNIPMWVCNTFDPGGARTLVNATPKTSQRAVVGIAGKPGFIGVNARKWLANGTCGYAEHIVHLATKRGISIETSVTGIDSMSLIFANTVATETLAELEHELRTYCKPGRVEMHRDIALICVVGHQMHDRSDVEAAMSRALATAGISKRAISQPLDELTIMYAVDESRLEDAIRAIYNAFVPGA